MSLKILIGIVIFEFRKVSFKNFQNFSHIGSVLSFFEISKSEFWKLEVIECLQYDEIVL